MVLEAKVACILTYDLDVLPPKPFESITGNLAERGREVDKKDLAEEGRYVNEFAHGFDIITCSASDLPIKPKVSIQCRPQVVLVVKLTSTQTGLEGTVPESTLCLICAATSPSKSSRPCSNVERVAS